MEHCRTMTRFHSSYSFMCFQMSQRLVTEHHHICEARTPFLDRLLKFTRLIDDPVMVVPACPICPICLSTWVQYKFRSICCQVPYDKKCMLRWYVRGQSASSAHVPSLSSTYLSGLFQETGLASALPSLTLTRRVLYFG